MICRRTLVFLFGAMVAPMLHGCRLDEPDATLRYRMTVEVETPEGLRQGSSVRELRFVGSDGGTFFAQGRSQIEVTAEAVIVDLPDGGALFALLRGADGDSDYGSRIADRSGIWSADKSLTIGPITELWPTAPNTVQLTNSSPVPMLVTFQDITNPTSVERVEISDLGAVFGKGYQLKRVTVQVTDDPVTAGIKKRLGWLSKYPEPRLDPDYKGSTNPNFAQSLSHGDFFDDRSGDKFNYGEITGTQY